MKILKFKVQSFAPFNALDERRGRSETEFAHHGLRVRSIGLLCGSPVNVLAIADFVDSDDADVIIDEVNNPVVALAHPVTILVACKFL